MASSKQNQTQKCVAMFIENIRSRGDNITKMKMWISGTNCRSKWSKLLWKTNNNYYNISTKCVISFTFEVINSQPAKQSVEQASISIWNVKKAFPNKWKAFEVKSVSYADEIRAKAVVVEIRMDLCINFGSIILPIRNFWAMPCVAAT